MHNCASYQIKSATMFSGSHALTPLGWIFAKGISTSDRLKFMLDMDKYFAKI
jgi:hypothetical protein